MQRPGRRKVITSINVESDDYEKLRQAADRRRVPLAYIVREILHREVEHWPVVEREAVPA